MRLIAIFLAAAALHAYAAEITGSWRAEFTCPVMERPKTVPEIILNLKADGAKLTGVVQAGNWPGEARFTNGKIDGDRVSFTVIGKSPWKMTGPSGNASGYPRLTFTGTIQGEKMQLKLVWDSVVIYGEDSGAAREYEMQGKKTTD